MNQTFKRTLLALGLAAFLITGCSAAPKNMNTTTGSQDDYYGEPGYDKGEKPDSLSPDRDGTTDPPSGVLDQKLVKSAAITLSAKDIEIAQIEIQRIAKQFSGYVYYMEQSQTSDKRYLTITIKVISTSFDEVIELIKKLGTTTNVTLNVSDVTTQFIDTEAHIKTLKTKEETLNNILAKATTIEDILTIETNLQQTRQEIESYQGQLNALKNSTDFSKITIYVNDETGLATTQTPESPWARFSSQFNRGLRYWGNAAIDVAANILFLLPVLVLLLILGFIIRLLVKRNPNHWIRRRSTISRQPKCKRGIKEDIPTETPRKKPDSNSDQNQK